VELGTQPGTDLKPEVWCDSDVTRIEKTMQVSSEKETIGHLMETVQDDRPDV